MNRYPVSPNADEFLTYLGSLTAGEFADLKNAYRYRRLKTTLMSVGGVMLILGIFILLPSIPLALRSPAYFLMVAYAGVITILGLVALIKRSPVVLLLFASIFAFVGLLAVIVSFVPNVNCLCGGAASATKTTTNSMNTTSLLLVIALVQWFIAACLGYSYWRNRRLGNMKLSRELFVQYDHIWTELARTRYAQNDQRFEVKYGGFRWVGFLLGERAILASTRSKFIIFMDLSELNFLPSENPATDNPKIKGKVQMGQYRLPVKLDRIFFDRYQQWKSATLSENNEAIT